MRSKVLTLLFAAGLAVTPSLAQAQSRRDVEQTRMIDGTLGAVAGALIGGPIGLIAGAALGYTMGPEVTGPVTQPGRIRTARRAHRRRAPARVAVQQAAPQG